MYRNFFWGVWISMSCTQRIPKVGESKVPFEDSAVTWAVDATRRRKMLSRGLLVHENVPDGCPERGKGRGKKSMLINLYIKRKCRCFYRELYPLLMIQWCARVRPLGRFYLTSHLMTVKEMVKLFSNDERMCHLTVSYERKGQVSCFI